MGKAKRTPVYQTGATKPIGHVVADELRVTVNGQRHFLRRRPVIAFPESAIREASRLGATCVRVNDKETGAVYRVAISDLLLNGKQFDLMYEKRIALHLSKWEKEEGNIDQLLLWA
jgi:hypothetical protein